MISLRKRLGAHAAAAATMLALVMVYEVPPGENSFYPSCPFFQLTGWECPGCGSTRALHALLHLRWVEAMALNPVFTALFPFLLMWGIAQYVSFLRTGGFIALKIPRRAYAVIAMLIFVFGILRNLPHWGMY